MEFGVYVTDPRTAARDAQFAESHGYTHVWVGDVPLTGFLGDSSVILALAATATKRVTLGTSIAAASLRSAPAIVHAIATINALAPGRAILGLGSASFTRGLAGVPPLKMREFRSEAETISGLLRNGEAAYSFDGRSTKLRFLSREPGSINLNDRIPLYIAASAPKAAAVAGELGDGLITTGVTEPAVIRTLLQQARAAARSAGREWTGMFPYVLESYVCVLRKGETLESPRVIDSLGIPVLMWFKSLAVGAMPLPGGVPASIHQAYAAWSESIGLLHCPPDERHLRVWEGVFQFRPDERRFVPSDALRALCLVGPPEELIERIKALEEAGVTEITVFGEEAIRDTAELAARL